MTKYRGKYKKCRSCKHAVEVLGKAIMVKNTCPKGTKFASCFIVHRLTCEKCEQYERATNIKC